MKIYHGCPSPRKLRRAREAAPSFTHGAEFPPYRMTKTVNCPWLLDNGAFTGKFDLEEFVWALDKCASMPRPPDFVVLPDVYQEGMRSLARSARHADLVASYGYDYYLPVQDGMRNVEQTVRTALDLGASGIFVGGSDGFTREYAGQYSMTAHDYDLKCHIGAPDERLLWARDIGVDSIDTTTIVRKRQWGKLRSLEASSSTEQRRLG